MNQKKHFYWIDLLRFIAAFLVMIAHYRGAFFVEYGLLPSGQQNIITQLFYLITRFGEEPVLIFFVLSGFLVGGISLSKISENKANVKSYTIDRFVRIMLPLIASTVLVIIIDLITHSSIPYWEISGSLISIQGIYTKCNFNPPLWSLAYEVWFYVLMGCIMFISQKNNSNKLFAFIILSISLYIFTILKPLYLFIWFLGGIAFLLPHKNIKYKKTKITLLLIALGISFILSQITSDSRSIQIDYFNVLNRNISSIILAVVTCFLISILIETKPSKNITIKLDNIGTKFAKFSYSLYLSHYPLIKLFEYIGFPKSASLNIQSLSLYIFELSIGLLVSYIVYLSSEKHTHKIKEFLYLVLSKRKVYQ